jgi:nucleoside-diphosphate-sugar epimerase
MTKPVLITGATGFIGAAVVRALRTTGSPVAVLLRDPSKPGRLQNFSGLIVLKGDLSDPASYRDALARLAPGTVLHLAWTGVAGAERNDPAQYDNIGATLALLDAAIATGASRFIGVGSQAEYGPHAGRLSEDTDTHPTTLYGAAKLATYLLCERRCALAGLSFAWVRVFSTFGPGDDPNTMISYLVRTLVARERPKLTAAEQLWDYLFVDDAGEAITALAGSKAAGVFNLGSGRTVRLRDIITMARDLVDPGLPLGFGEVPYRPDQVMHLEADISALQRETGWSPRHSLGEGLTRIVEHAKRKGT